MKNLKYIQTNVPDKILPGDRYLFEAYFKFDLNKEMNPYREIIDFEIKNVFLFDNTVIVEDKYHQYYMFQMESRRWIIMNSDFNRLFLIQDIKMITTVKDNRVLIETFDPISVTQSIFEKMETSELITFKFPFDKVNIIERNPDGTVKYKQQFYTQNGNLYETIVNLRI